MVDPVGSIEPPQLPRPVPDRRFTDRAAAWLAWFGLARLFATALCVGAVAFAAFWLLRVPSPAAESTLPRAAPSSTPPVATLPVAATTPPAATSPQVIVVHVAGAVRTPGVYELDGAHRVHDAIDRAGGPGAAADLDALNLALELTDGQRLYVPSLGEVAQEAQPYVSPEPDAASAAVTATAPGSPIDLNRANASDLETLPGIGPSTAAAIVDDRERNGPFSSVDDLERVPGIGPSKLGAIRDLVEV